ncbi:serine hydrolase domain-containing protein [Paenibacillus mendelii]|uniref:Serine hydrolase domain-containing protein n=1 Tax=Paenibacillus mendelii TaxID=206163 RepID=A0ABV6J8C8_9BACL|nr:serine hydrolase [Paenibacillus mendelii]MCQ6562141.1 beta-lactamase family protein [Paenibacillus mendelii]
MVVNPFPRSRPEEQGVSSGAISNFLDAVHEKGFELHSFMLVRHGHVISEGWWSPYEANLPHMMFSLSKSFTSTAIGLAAAEGLLSLTDRVVSFFPEDTPEDISAHLADMQVRHLLMMGSGHAQDVTDWMKKEQDGNWVIGFLAAPVEYEPGTHFVYNSAATYMLSAILNRVTKQSLLDYLQPRLFEPLGIEDAAWESCPRGIHVGGWGLSIRTEDIAKFGQLYLNKGQWHGQQILPAQWVEEATSKHISNGDGGESDWAQGYGYQFWRCRQGIYRGDGAFGQYCIVMPDQDAVLAITGGTNELQGVLNLVWENLLPGMNSNTLPIDEAAASQLEAQVKQLQLRPLLQPASSPREESLFSKRYSLAENPHQWKSISIRFEAHEAIVTIRFLSEECLIRFGRGVWVEKETRFSQEEVSRAAGCFTWLDADTLELTVRFVEKPFCQVIRCHFEGTNIVVEQAHNVAWVPVEYAPIRGVC